MKATQIVSVLYNSWIEEEMKKIGAPGLHYNEGTEYDITVLYRYKN